MQRNDVVCKTYPTRHAPKQIRISRSGACRRHFHGSAFSGHGGYVSSQKSMFNWEQASAAGSHSSPGMGRPSPRPAPRSRHPLLF